MTIWSKEKREPRFLWFGAHFLFSQSANRKYWGRSQHSQEEKNQNERRRERLQEIKEELPTLASVFRKRSPG